jgi:thiol-disulfide isomerase/thioredoxin
MTEAANEGYNLAVFGTRGEHFSHHGARKKVIQNRRGFHRPAANLCLNLAILSLGGSMRRIFLRALFATISIGTAALVFAQTDPIPLIKSGDQLRREGRFQEAYKSYEKANKGLGEKCAPCLVRMALAKLNLGDVGGSLKLVDRSLAVASSAHERADAFATRGEILLAVAKDNPKKLAAAEDAFQSAIKEDPEAHIFHMKLGQALLREGKIDDGRKELQGYLAMEPRSPNAETVERWLKFPAKVRYLLSPHFALTTARGDAINSDGLAGKVVLIDFWATWCPPCRESVPELKELTQKYSREKLAIISVSSDDDQKQWKEFIEQKQMDWPQYIDSDHHMTKLFDVHAFPTYIIIDGDGFVRERIVSFDPQESLAHRLKEPLKKMLE